MFTFALYKFVFQNLKILSQNITLVRYSTETMVYIHPKTLTTCLVLEIFQAIKEWIICKYIKGNERKCNSRLIFIMRCNA